MRALPHPEAKKEPDPARARVWDAQCPDVLCAARQPTCARAPTCKNSGTEVSGAKLHHAARRARRRRRGVGLAVEQGRAHPVCKWATWPAKHLARHVFKLTTEWCQSLGHPEGSLEYAGCRTQIDSQRQRVARAGGRVDGNEVCHGVPPPVSPIPQCTRHAASDKTKDYLVFGSLMLRNWRVASTTDSSIGNRSADEPPT